MKSVVDFYIYESILLIDLITYMFVNSTKSVVD